MSARPPPTAHSLRISLITPDPGADEARRRGLRQMRTVAVGLLLLAACVYVATLGRDGFWGFVNAGAEASMVGAIADWFAVTALFKHPLGLPIPHTALIPRRKDELGKGLEEFVGENFLQEDVIRERVAAATISARVGRLARRPGQRAPRGRRGLRRRRDRARQGARRPHRRPGDRGTGAALPRGADLAAAGHDADGGAARRPAPRRRRPRRRRDAPLAGRQPRHLRPGARGAGAVVGAAQAQRRGHHPDPRRGGRVGRGHPRRPAPPGPRGARLDARPARARPAQRRGDDGPRRGVQGPAARAPAGRHHGDLAVEGDAVGPARLGPRPRGRRAPAPARGAQPRSPAGSARTPRCASGSTAWPPTSPSS